MKRIPVIVFAFIILLYAVINISAGETGTSLVVATEAGLRLRESPDTKGKVIVTIPFKSTVKVLEETGEPVTISGKTGKWCKITWKNKTGWAFGGFLAESAEELSVFEKKCADECSKSGSDECAKIHENYTKYKSAMKRINVNDQLAVDDMGFARAALKKCCPKTVENGLD